ncbi:consortin [Brachionichthys hirsutus]|uniref:consortin n=1 Tax=Brachionichthys hirsutus TaxID=412623 RepID=UPI003604D3CC
MSPDEVGAVDFCDNLPNPEVFKAQMQNLNETNTIAQSESFFVSHKDEEDSGGHAPAQQASLSSHGKDKEKENEWENKGCTAGCREEDEEEDTDEVMKEEEEEMSEGSSSLICCQSPDTLMTDSSYSETGSLLETPYPFSPGTSPEPTSPVVAIVSPETRLLLSENIVQMESHTLKTDWVASNTGSITLGPPLTVGPVDSVALAMTSYTGLPCPHESTCITEAKKTTSSATEHFTSSTEPIVSHEATCATSHTGPTTVPCTTTRSSSMDSTPGDATTGPLKVTAAPAAGSETSNWEQMTSPPVPTCFSVSTCTKGATNHYLLDALEQLARRGDDTHLPQYLHQIAEAFVLQEDYQRALWCIQLERVYHQRVLDNLNALQGQWESQCRRTSTGEATNNLDTLRLVCQSHTRPSAKDAECASLDVLRPTSVEGGTLPPCISAHQINEGMERRSKVSSHSQSCHPVKPSTNLAVRLDAPEISPMDTEDRHRGFSGRDVIDCSQLIDRNTRGIDEGKEGVEDTISVITNELHPSKAGEMDQSKPAEQQGGDLGLIQEKEAKSEEERDKNEEEVEAVEMEEEGEDEEEEKLKEGDAPFDQKALPVESPASGAELEIQQLHWESGAEQSLHDEVSAIPETCLHQEEHLPQDVHMKQQQQQQEEEEEEEEEWGGEEGEEEQEDEYEVEQADIIREAASLEEIAKFITVEMSHASGLVSILKKRHVCVDTVEMSSGSASQPGKPAKRRVRFSVPNDGSEQDVGSVDSCLLLFLLCLVTVVISVGGTALYCALGDAQSSVCQDFSRNADFYFGQIHRGISHIQHWFRPAS